MPGFFPAPGPTQLLATGGGVINGSNMTIFTTPSGGAGSPMLEANGAGSAIYLDINSAGTITGSGSLLTENVFGGSSVFLQAQNSGLIEAYDLTQSFPTGGNDIGAQALTGGTIILIGGSLTVDSGGGNFGLQANGGTITTNGTTINLGTPSSPNGGSDVGAEAIGGGTLRLTASSVNVYSSGGGNTGLLASGPGSTITTTNVNVTMENPANPPHVDVDTGVEAAAGGAVTMSGGTVAVNGIGSSEKGLWATGAGSTINASGVAISVPNGNNSAGVQADTSGAITLTSNSTIATGGTNTPGGLLMNGGTLTMTGGSVTTTGPSSNGFTISGGAPADTLALTNVTVSASQGNSFNVNGPTANITLADTTAIVNNGTVLLTQGGATTTFTASGSTLQGVMTTTGSTANVTLQDATTWTMTGNSNVTNLTNNDSLIDYTAPSNGVFKTLTTVNYMGTGGTIGLNTYLGADGSPSDLLVINGGTATGSTVLHITNADGPGAQTQANGIEVVSALGSATTDAGAFSLGGQEVRAGAFDYYLFRGGINGSEPQDWFLRSSFDVPPITPPIVPPPPPAPVEPPIIALPQDPPPDPLPPGNYPIIGPEIATYGVVQPIARQLGLATLGTLHDRIGDTLLDEVEPCLAGSNDYDNTVPTLARQPSDCTASSRRPAAWARVFGESIDNRYLAFADPGASGQLLGFQGGLDLWRGSFVPGHRDAAGLYASYADAYAGVTGLITNAAATGYVMQHTGSVNLNSWSGGAYWTHYGPSGWYLDAVAQATAYATEASTQFAQLDAPGYGILGSLEAGYPIALPFFGPGFALEPQAQVIEQYVAFGAVDDTFGEVDLGTTTGTTGRLGLRGRWTFETAQGMQWQPYLRANFWRDWGGDATTTYSGVDQVPLLEEADRVELGGGLTVKINDAFSFYANGDDQFAVGDTQGGEREAVRGAAGLRYTW